MARASSISSNSGKAILGYIGRIERIREPPVEPRAQKIMRSAFSNGPCGAMARLSPRRRSRTSAIIKLVESA